MKWTIAVLFIVFRPPIGQLGVSVRLLSDVVVLTLCSLLFLHRQLYLPTRGIHYHVKFVTADQTQARSEAALLLCEPPPT